MSDKPEYGEAANKVLPAAIAEPSTEGAVSAALALCEEALRGSLPPRDETFVRASSAKFIYHLLQLGEGNLDRCSEEGISNSPLATRAESEICAALRVDRNTPEDRFFKDSLQRASYIDECGAPLWSMESRYRQKRQGPQACIEYLTTKVALFAHCRSYMPPLLANDPGHAYMELKKENDAKRAWEAGVASDTAEFEEAGADARGFSIVRMMHENLQKKSAASDRNASGCAVLLGLIALASSALLLMLAWEIGDLNEGRWIG